MICVRILRVALLGLSLAGCREPRPFSPAEEANSPELQEWLEIWRTDIPDLSADSFEFERKEEFSLRTRREFDYAKYISEYLEEADLSWEKMRKNVQVSPDGRWALDHLIYQLSARDGELHFGLEPDSHVVLIDVGTMKGYFTVQGGTPTYFHRPIWLNSEVFLVLSSEQLESPKRRCLRISRWDIGREKYSVFRGPCVSTDRDSEAWTKLSQWNRRRYSDIIW
jgi:hypothetical protein